VTRGRRPYGPGMDQFPTDLLRRREVLIAAGGLGVAAVGAGSFVGAVDSAAAADCVLLQREVTEGPYYLDLDLHRRNIREDRKGIPLTLRFRVLNVNTCRVIKGAAVEIWHADGSGDYSGVSGDSDTYLRGIQKTNSKGWVRFETIYPGWYMGRTPHIHMKVFVSGKEVHTGQVFMKDAVSAKVYSRGIYAPRGQADTTNSEDTIYAEAGRRALLHLRRNGDRIADGYTGTLDIGVNPS
jgi:protocatechuate 3,4-dioxygenase beta subunit